MYIFDNNLRGHLQHNLDKFHRRDHNDSAKKKAAVAVVVVNAGDELQQLDLIPPDPSEAALVLTRRSLNLKKHAGQWAFPGGTLDEGEEPEETALRELHEEVGLKLGKESILGKLDDFTTRSGFTITPVVIWGGKDPLLIPNLNEVRSIHCIPLTEFYRSDSPQLQSIPESDNPVLLMPVGRGVIATPTGAIIYQFREVALAGEDVRVYHYEQPYFAWK